MIVNDPLHIAVTHIATEYNANRIPNAPKPADSYSLTNRKRHSRIVDVSVFLWGMKGHTPIAEAVATCMKHLGAGKEVDPDDLGPFNAYRLDQVLSHYSFKDIFSNKSLAHVEAKKTYRDNNKHKYTHKFEFNKLLGFYVEQLKNDPVHHPLYTGVTSTRRSADRKALMRLRKLVAAVSRSIDPHAVTSLTRLFNRELKKGMN